MNEKARLRNMNCTKMRMLTLQKYKPSKKLYKSKRGCVEVNPVMLNAIGAEQKLIFLYEHLLWS